MVGRIQGTWSISRNTNLSTRRSSSQFKLRAVAQLLELAERAFIFKLTKSQSNITPEEIKAAVRDWYAIRPGAEFGDGVGVPGDPTRFES